jgi:hypothetical protein
MPLDPFRATHEISRIRNIGQSGLNLFEVWPDQWKKPQHGKDWPNQQL